jgi:glucuronate isomerase
MPAFLDEDFLLESDVAIELYRQHAREAPIIDFHCHLSADDIAADRRFRSLSEIWLEGDHYKWRAMRMAGIPECLITGAASDWDKFEAWARAVPELLRNPLYQWTHMELKRPFGIETRLSPATAREIFERANARLREDDFSAQGLLRTFRVAVVCTTDDPTDSLKTHAGLARRESPVTRVYPTWRPDAALAVEDPAAFNAWVARLEAAAGMPVSNWQSLLDALARRHSCFHELGCRASDHGLEHFPRQRCSDPEAAVAFEWLRSGRTLEPEQAGVYRATLLHYLALLDHARGWVQQFHIGILRNNNTRMWRTVGRDAGFDSIGDFDQARPLARFLDHLDCTDQLAKTILYNGNPANNELFATMCGNFADGRVPGKMQLGSGWWFLDQKEGMEAQMRALSNAGLIARFVGMVTDSRSFLSFSRHDFFRRVLCNLLGQDLRRGLIPDDRDLLGRMVRNICFANAREYFGFELGTAARGYTA